MSHVFNTTVKPNAVQPFDPHRMPEAVKVVAPVNTRTFLYHESKPEIIIEGVGKDDAERIADFDQKLRDKLKLGYSTDRQQHGTHPHSNDTARIEMQQLDADRGDRKAKVALAAKAARTTQSAKSAEDLVLENELLQERIARLEAEAKLGKQNEKHDKQ